MHVFFEEDGAFKAGTVLVDNDTSLQVEAVSGKRVKVKAANVLLRFDEPAPGTMLTEAHTLAATLDPNFLWEVSGEGEFAFNDLAADYYGRAPRAAEAVALAICLHAAPMYFYRKGRGRYKAAPEDALKAALAGAERKRRDAEVVDALADALVRGELPEAVRASLPMLLYKPDKLALETRALAAACDKAHASSLELLSRCGAIPSTHDYHFNRFLFEAFPNGTEFPPLQASASDEAWPLADVRAFSVDDATTTEIDDALSARVLDDGNIEVGIHIAAPALGIARGSPLDAVARARLSTVYMPGRKITMLPDALIQRYTLEAGTTRPAVSIYVETDAEGTPLRYETRLERIAVTENLRLDAIDETFAAEPAPEIARDATTAAFALRAAWKLARKLEAGRGKPDIARVDYSFSIDWESPDGRVSIEPRRRGSPTDKLVAELMIFVNSTWGALLAERSLPGLYRTQQSGKVRMGTRPEPHQGLGVAQYLWASSPLRRYSDLVNQRQIIAVASERRAPYDEKDAELMAAVADFEVTYAQYGDFQDRMERYWCLRYLLQEGIEEAVGTPLRGGELVRLERVPLVVRLADLPESARDRRVRVALARVDLLATTVEARYAGVID